MARTVNNKTKRAKMIAEAACLAYVVNSQTEYCIFFEYSGHVDHMRMDIAESKERYNNKLASSEFWRSDSGNVESWLQSKIDHLKHILDTGEIGYDRMRRFIHEVSSYEF